MRMLRAFIRIMDTVSEKLGNMLSILIPVMVAVLVIEVVARYAFQSPTVWAHETSIFLYGYCGMLAGAYTLKHRGHINVDIVYSRLSPRTKAILDVLTGLLFFLMVGLIIHQGWEMGMKSLVMHEHTSSPWGPPLAHFRLVIPVGAFLLMLQGIANWVRKLYLAVTNRELTI